MQSESMNEYLFIEIYVLIMSYKNDIMYVLSWQTVYVLTQV